MLTIDEIKAAAEKVAPLYDISHIYLFGSYARGDATEKSDVDFRIVGGKLPSLFDIGGLYYDFEENLGKRIDLVISKNMKPTFYDLIKDEEVLIYAKI